VADPLAPTISRRSIAIGWRRAMVSTARSSMVAAECRFEVGGDHAFAEHHVARISASTESVIMRLRPGRHLGRPAGSCLQIAVERLAVVFRSHCCSPQITVRIGSDHDLVPC